MNKLFTDKDGVADFSGWEQDKLLLYLKNSAAYDDQPLIKANRERAIKELLATA